MRLSAYIRLLQEIQLEHGDIETVEYNESKFAYQDELEPSIVELIPVAERRGVKYYQRRSGGMKACLI